jgi:hypothetical protein
MSRFIQREFSRADMNLHTNIDNGQLITNFLVNKGIAPTLKDFDPSPEKAKKVGIKNEEEVSWEEKRNQEVRFGNFNRVLIVREKEIKFL